MYDSKSYEKSDLMKAFVNSIFLMGNIAYERCKYSNYLREDDYPFSIFSFPLVKSNKIKN